MFLLWEDSLHYTSVIFLLLRIRESILNELTLPKTTTTERHQFLAAMLWHVPWQQLLALLLAYPWGIMFSLVSSWVSYFSTRSAIFLKWFWNWGSIFQDWTGRCFSTHIIYENIVSEDVKSFEFRNLFSLKADSIWLYENVGTCSRKAGHWNMILSKYNYYYKCDYGAYGENTSSAKILSSQT